MIGVPPVSTEISSNIALRRSPNPGAFTAAIFNPPRNLFTTNVANASTPGYLTVYPAGVRAPIASNINFPAFTAVPNLVEVGIGNGGEVSVISATSVDVAVDLQGYVRPGATGAGLYNPLSTPARICDTRAANPSKLISPATQCNGGAGNPGDSLKVDTPYPVQVTGDGGVPAVARGSAVVLNVTVVGPAAKGYLTAYPTGENPPTASNLNWVAGQTVPNLVTVALSAAGTFEAENYAGSADVIVDIEGYYAAGAATSLALALLVGGRVFTAMKRSLKAGEWVRRALGVQVAVGRAVQHQRQHDLGEQHRLQVRLGRGRL